MNTLGKSLMAGTAATALAFAAPAQARDGDGGIDAGDVVAGVLILGGIAAIAASIDDDRDDRYDRRRDRRYDRHDRRYGGYYGHRVNPRRAVRRCIAAAQREASYYGRARVTEVTDIDRRDDGWRVRGRVVVNEGRGHWRGRGYHRRIDYRGYDEGRFNCRIRHGRIERLRVRGLG